MENTPKAQEGLSLTIFKDKSQIFLNEIFTHFPKARQLIIPSFLSKYIGFLLNEEIVKRNTLILRNLTNFQPQKGSGTLFFIAPSDSQTINQVIQAFDDSPQYEKVILALPRSTKYLQDILADKFYNVFTSFPTPDMIEDSHRVYLFDFPSHFLPIDNDFFLLPCIHSFRKININANYEDIYISAQAIFKIEDIYGSIPHISCVGLNADRVFKTIFQMHQTRKKPQIEIPQIDSLILIDRCSDLITPLITELSIEGLINAAFHIEYSFADINIKQLEQELQSTSKPTQEQKADVLNDYHSICFNESNEIFREIRMMPYQHFQAFFPKLMQYISSKLDDLSKHSKEYLKQGKLKEIFLETADLIYHSKKKAEDLYLIINSAFKILKERCPAFEEIYQKEFQMIENHQPGIDLAENLILMYNDWPNALRLLCLESILGHQTRSPGDVQQIQNEIANEFGVEESREGLLNLEKSKLLSKANAGGGLDEMHPGTKITAEGCLDYLNLLGPTDERNLPADAFGTALGGYVPPTVRFVQKITDETMRELQKELGDKIYLNEYGQLPKRKPGDHRKIIVFFVGGVTLTEVGTIRNVARTYYHGEIEFIVGATDAISYNTFLNQLCPFLQKTSP